MFIGIDYGSKVAGTTVIAYLEDGKLLLQQSSKKEDTDQMLLDFVSSQQSLTTVYIDDPLSLPSALMGQKGGNYFYRECDRLLRAMSPMFLGGLTARAIQLKHQIESKVEVHEVYPGGFVRNHEVLKPNYQKKDMDIIPNFTAQLMVFLPFPLGRQITNWHQVDSLLAWYIGWKHQQAEHESFGDQKEGMIFI